MCNSPGEWPEGLPDIDLTGSCATVSAEDLAAITNEDWYMSVICSKLTELACDRLGIEVGGQKSYDLFHDLAFAMSLGYDAGEKKGREESCHCGLFCTKN